MLSRLKLGIIRNPKKFLLSIFFGVTALWAISEPFVTFFSDDINKYWFLFLFGIISIIISFVRIYPKLEVSIPLKNTNTTVKIKFGDLFKQNGIIAIPVNEYFDSEIGKTAV